MKLKRVTAMVEYPRLYAILFYLCSIVLSIGFLFMSGHYSHRKCNNQGKYSSYTRKFSHINLVQLPISENVILSLYLKSTSTPMFNPCHIRKQLHIQADYPICNQGFALERMHASLLLMQFFRALNLTFLHVLKAERDHMLSIIYKEPLILWWLCKRFVQVFYIVVIMQSYHWERTELRTELWCIEFHRISMRNQSIIISLCVDWWV